MDPHEVDDDLNHGDQDARHATATGIAAQPGDTDQQRRRRLESMASRASVRRQMETPEERQKRQATDARRAAAARAAETPEERERRQEGGQRRMAAARAAETPEEQQRRQEADRARQQRRRRNAAAIPPTLHRAAVMGTENAVPAVLQNMGEMNKVCEHQFCSAFHFQAEKGNLLHSCCHSGKVAAPPLSPYPEQLTLLLTGDTPESRNLREHIRQYNSANAFASFGARTEAIPGFGPYCFKISGEVYHLATSALVQDVNEPQNAPQPRYGQLFIYDPVTAVNYRMHVQENAECDRQIMTVIDQVLREVNPYVDHYLRLHQAAQAEERRAARMGMQPRQLELRLVRHAADDQRRYNAPTTNRECMYLIESGDGEVPALDLAVHPVDRVGCTRINPYSRHVDPMVFPILFPQGDSGYYIGVQNPIELQGRQRELTALQFYSSRIAVRAEFNPLHHAGKLFQQYVVHAYCTVESQRLMYIRNNQKQLRVECYQGLIDFLAEAAAEQNLRAGNLFILPSTFVGSPRYMRQKYYDAMTIVRKFGRPDLFITFTCNPRWMEIASQLQPYQDASARPDIVSRVFQLKVEELMRLVKKEKIFGTVVAFVYVIEWQKRGLPHLHSLFWLDENDAFRTGDQVDRVISAEIPDPDADENLYYTIMTNNIHGPCGSKCMKDGRCQKDFPKPFQDVTDMSGEGYPKYRRREPKQGQRDYIRDRTIDNRWVVPYNPFLSKTFNAHINVEMCHTISAIKYLCKYFTKGHDRARVSLREQGGQLILDEIHNFVDTRCITPTEATWRLLENDIHQQSHTVYELAVHLPGGQRIFFEEGQEEEALRRASTRDTTLTAWFNLNQRDPEARTHLYQDIPTFYVMKKAGGNVQWQFRQRGHESVIGRVASISPRNVELYHLRLLLLNVPGATSFEDLRTVNGRLYDTFREAALARELVVHDDEWRRCMEEAALYMMPYQLRSLFAIILINCDVDDAAALWQEFRLSMTEDFRHVGHGDAASETLALLQIQSDLQEAGTNCAEKGIPEPGPMAEQPHLPDENPATHAARGQEMLNMLNEHQRAIAERVLAAVDNPDPGEDQCIFVHGHGGTGKTFLYETITHILHGARKTVLCVAFTGIAAILLPGGRTCHMAFRLPLQLDANAACHLSLREKAALQKVDVIIWDEASMPLGDMLTVVDRLLRDLMKKDNIPFGGKVMLLGGDFRQVLPVIPHGTRKQIVDRCIKSSPLMHHFRHMRLTINMRARPEEVAFAEWLLQLGDGRLPRPVNAKTDASIELPPQCITNNVVRELFGQSFLPDDANMHQRVILCPLNEDARLKNEEILDKLHGEKITRKSVDVAGAVEGEDEAVLQQLYPTEFLNSVSLTGLPPHALNLKRGAIVMLIRNLCVARGLCNGTRLVVMDAKQKVLQVKIISGAHRGTVHFLPRITLDTKDDVNVPFNLRRRQFPVKLAYAMTINKAQGQTFDKVGLFLRNPVFTHGQLYVACSRVRSFDSLFIEVIDGDQQGTIDGVTMTDNIVYKEVL